MGVISKTLLLVQQLNMEETTQNTIIIKEVQDHQVSNKATRRRRRSRTRRSNSLMMKNRRSSRSRIEQRVTTLRNLISNDNDNDSDDNNDDVESLEQLFTQTADYILSLQTRVRLMKTLVDVFGSSSSSIDE